MKPLLSLLTLLTILAGCQSESETKHVAPECEQVEERQQVLAKALEDAKKAPLPRTTTSPDPSDGSWARELRREQERNQQAHDEAVEAARLDWIEEAAVLARQHPECFTVEQRSQLEKEYQRIRDERIRGE